MSQLLRKIPERDLKPNDGIPSTFTYYTFQIHLRANC